MRTPTTMPAPRALKSWVSATIPRSCSAGMIESSAKKPSTIVGIPASSSSTGLTDLRTRSGAYSRGRRPPSPSGIATTAAIAAMYSEAARSTPDAEQGR